MYACICLQASNMYIHTFERFPEHLQYYSTLATARSFLGNLKAAISLTRTSARVIESHHRSSYK